MDLSRDKNAEEMKWSPLEMGAAKMCIRDRLTTYRQDTAAIGATAAAKLIELIEKPRTALVDRILIPGKLVEGGSVRAI